MKVKPTYWELLLKLKSVYNTVNTASQSIIITEELEIIISELFILPKDGLVIIRFNSKATDNKEFFEIGFSDSIRKSMKKMFELYLPYIIINSKAETPFSFVHIAQTIDGKIATPTGKSKWIGNQENLVHAHRIRALVDAILVGANTFKLDKPQLDVRHVKGDNPIKIIIANSKLDLDCLSIGETILFSTNEIEYQSLPENTESICIEQEGNSIITTDLLKVLKQKGIHSLLIEGGSQTIRKFIEDKSIDRIEFHIAPMIFGSGKSGIELAEIDNLEEGIHLQNPTTFKMGNALMIVSNL
jgi:diaminohydroxyphosphoribosylaminopyrimidine deaminase/5-amino-6-(5-phosphoribosylamino)uracil reductase